MCLGPGQGATSWYMDFLLEIILKIVLYLFQVIQTGGPSLEVSPNRPSFGGVLEIIYSRGRRQ